jgi:hypothetical protein
VALAVSASNVQRLVCSIVCFTCHLSVWLLRHPGRHSSSSFCRK